MSKKPSVPKGTRDFSPQEVAKRSYIMETIKSSFQLYGFQPIETPSFENSETLMGKYGDEGDRLIFKILNSGDFLKTFNVSLIESIKDVLFNFQNYLKESKDNSKIKIKYFKDNFLEVYPKILKANNKIKFEEDKTKFKQLAADIWHFIEFYIVDEDNNIEKLKDANNEILTDFTMKVYGGFYYNLAPQYITEYISEKALRYDLTVPFARYVVQHQNEITFPFKRYQMQPVWRADRPQKGRFREFWQCDADVVGSDSLWQEIELVQLYDDVFAKLQLSGITIKINNRKILTGIAEVIGAEDKLIDFTVALDKLDKIGEEGVKKEMLEKGISNKALEKLQPLFSFTGNNTDKLNSLSQLLTTSETGKKGIEEVQFVINAIQELGLKASEIELDVTLARGLNYYTGAIFEVSAPEKVQMGSIGGGGRYDDLTGIFGLKGVSGVGISFGLDRIFLVLEELGLFPKTVEENTKVLFINFGQTEALYAMQAITALRKNNIASELYPDAIKMGKQMMYADKRSIPFVVIAGGNEMESKTFTLKNLKTGEQEVVTMEELLKQLKD